MRLSLLTAGVCWVTFGAMSTEAQIISPPPARHVAYVEAGGPGGFYSANYERLVDETTSIRIGGTYWDLTNLDNVRERVRGVIVGAAKRYDESVFFGQGPGRYVEVSGAFMLGEYQRERYGVSEVSGAYVSFAPQVGLRYEPAHGFLMRGMLTPLIPLVHRASAFPEPRAAVFAGVSLGYVFR